MSKAPCPKDCKDRNATCHTVCERYLKFVEENKERKRREDKDKCASYTAYISGRMSKKQP